MLPGTDDALAFDVSGDLPKGVTLLEASAGTGKTFTIAALVARYVAEGTPIEKLLVVTFTRMATGELRDRVRHRLVETASGLGQLMEGIEVDDEVVLLLGEGSEEEVARRHTNLLRAISDFDAATIDTTHGFCLHVLLGLGVAGDVDRGAKLVEDTRDLLDEVVQDLYVRKFWQSGPVAKLSLKVAKDIADKVLGNPSARIAPELSDLASTPAMRRRLAGAVQDEMTRRKRNLGILTYDDLLTRLRDALTDQGRGPSTCARMSERYNIVLVDEFQDTDPVQWDILRFAFADSTLVLIGDPKQAIYAFRGADVFAYLEAAKSATSRATLNTNWRSDQPLIRAYDAMFKNAKLGHDGIVYHPVEASQGLDQPCFEGAPNSTALRVRVLDRQVVGTNKDGTAKAAETQRHIARDLALDVTALLASGAKIAGRHDGGQALSPVDPGDIAVLVRTNNHALKVKDALTEAGVPAVLAGGSSVFESSTATDWLTLLVAIEKPTSRSFAAAAALTPFVGWSAEEVAEADRDQWDELHWRLARWSEILRDRGIAALVESVSSYGLPARVLGSPSGERYLTDVFHIGRLLHAASVEDNLGPTALVAWLRRRRSEAGKDRDNEDRMLRLESDAEAVQILTIHRSKGLEFPIVYCPFLWDGWERDDGIPVFHDPDNEDRLTIDVSGDTLGMSSHKQQSCYEDRGESLRLLYVALTRAQHQAVIWWAGGSSGRRSPLTRLLFCMKPDGTIDPDPRPLKPPTDSEAWATFEEIAKSAPGCVSVEKAEWNLGATWVQTTPSRLADLSLAVFDRTFDDLWKRTSYSGITAAAHEPQVGSEPEENLMADEASTPVAASSRHDPQEADQGEDPAAVDALRSIPLLLSEMPGGTSFGTFVHSVFEGADFACSDLASELHRAIDSTALRGPDTPMDRDLLVKGLEAAIETPLGSVVGDLSLRDFTRTDRLDEVSFELPLAGGDESTTSISMHDVSALLRTHLDPGDPVYSYADRLDDPHLLHSLHGYITGSIDLVVRLPDGSFAIADYKTNRLAPGTEGLTAWHYRPEALASAMWSSHYQLQAILYTVALHRYLRWRDPAYDPSRHLAGVLYLFVRGMSSPAFPRLLDNPCGVWSWKPPTSLVEALSDLFDTGSVSS